MSLLKDQKTNWKFILIVLILAIIVGGGILGYYWWAKEEIPSILQWPKKKISEEFTLQVNEEAKIIYEFKIPETGVEKKHEYIFSLFSIDPALKKVELNVIDLSTGLPCVDHRPGDRKLYLSLGESFVCLVTEEGGAHFTLVDLKENRATI